MDVKDKLGRPMRDLRISVTDRCNFRCVYCMPKEIFGPDYPYLDRHEILTYEEITRLTKIFTVLGVRKVRLTGGEPTLRREVEKLIAMLAQIPELEIAMTTNGSTLAVMAPKLRRAGLDRVTVSLDAMDNDIFMAMNDVDFPVERVLEGIAAAEAEKLTPIKINMVVKRGVNENQIIPMARHFRKSGHILRFIEYMDVGTTNDWKMDEVVPAKEIVKILQAEFELKALEPNYRGEVARRYGYVDHPGEIGIIASVTQPFCGDCTRARLSADGHLFTCLFSAQGYDLKTLLRSGVSDDQIRERLIDVWLGRTDRYSELRTSATQGGDKIEMSYIGG
ncbi:MAG: GTP 3',8-cyclase MoaA [Anaerolineales bacterium]|jgi:cyclic pyranopterin phosphate synthase